MTKQNHKTMFNEKTKAVVTSSLDFSGFNGNMGTFHVEFRKMESKFDLYNTGFHIEFNGIKLKNELECIFELSSELKRFLRR